MAIGRDDVVHVARLARLELSEEEMETFTGQLARIVEYFDKLRELDVEGQEPMMHAAEGALLRDDAKRDSLSRAKALQNAPSAGDGFFLVPPVIE